MKSIIIILFLVCVSVCAKIKVVPTTFDYYFQEINTTSTVQNFEIRNISSRVTTSFFIKSGECEQFKIQNLCPAQLTTLAKCSLNIIYSPNNIGNHFCELKFYAGGARLKLKGFSHD